MGVEINGNHNSGDHSKPIVLRDGLFMWEIVASFSTPRMVCTLESLCNDVKASLDHSSTGQGLLQRYWNVQYYRLLWDEERFDSTRRTLNYKLTRSEGKRNWKKMYVEEYPSWVERTIQGKGCNNNALNAAKALFKSSSLNDLLTGEQLSKLELTPKEALAKAMLKSGVEVDELKGEAVHGAKGDGSGAKPRIVDKKGRRKSAVHQTARDPSMGLSREDYRDDHRLAKRKGKNKKGEVNRWGAIANEDGGFE